MENRLNYPYIDYNDSQIIVMVVTIIFGSPLSLIKEKISSTASTHRLKLNHRIIFNHSFLYSFLKKKHFQYISRHYSERKNTFIFL